MAAGIAEPEALAVAAAGFAPLDAAGVVARVGAPDANSMACAKTLFTASRRR